MIKLKFLLMFIISMPLNMKDYIKHAQNCDDGFIKIALTFYPKPTSDFGISVEETFYQNKVKIGKCEKISNNIIIKDELASNFHGKMVKDDKGWNYSDKNALGTYVNGSLIKEQSVPLNIGDNLRIGNFGIRILDLSK